MYCWGHSSIISNMEKLNINGKTLDYGSIILSTSERFALGVESKFDNDAVIIRIDANSGNVTIPAKTQRLIDSYFGNDSVNVLFFDFYKSEEETTSKLLTQIHDNSISSDIIIIGTRKNESKEELKIRLDFARKLKREEKRPIIFLIDPRSDISVEELKKYSEFIDIIGLYLNVPFGGNPLIKKIISANLSIWQELEKPVFLLGIPRKMLEEVSKNIKYYHPFFSLLSNIFCTHFRHGASKSKYTEPNSNIIYTYDKLVEKFGEDFELRNICACNECENTTVKSFFAVKEWQLLARIRVHETFMTQNQLDHIKEMDMEQRIKYLSQKLNERIGPEFAQVGEINRIGVKGPVSEKFVKEMIEKRQSVEEANNHE